ncbi:MAG: 3-deoxy-manno-octulosonate cytidylyltransferase [Alphaproteobacteria bacterium MarineAlpha5_Bin11]|nr:MAG: 3-deoxy-manno-octulosonate cytidylyltransferase [Alphaproteobacteria bacterium MarineAlpha5_Bin11]
MRIVGVIPAHLASVRFPNKILLDILGIPMIEHVRRRALLCNLFDEVYVTTCDRKISEVVKKYGGRIIKSSNKHSNGTSRVAQAIEKISCSHVVILQGDEPLIDPENIETLINSIKKNKNFSSWNLTGPIKNRKELNKESFVKCKVARNNNIKLLFRKKKLFKNQLQSEDNIRKILGVIAFKKSFLKKIVRMPVTLNEKKYLIEQSRIVENNFKLKSVPIKVSLPSINEPGDEKIVLKVLKNNKKQNKLYKKTLKNI